LPFSDRILISTRSTRAAASKPMARSLPALTGFMSMSGF
jgi:hypothetical protein